VAAAVICTTAFEGMARRAAEALGMGTLPLVVIGHPLGGLRAEEVEARVREAAERLAALVAGPPPDRP
jgi:surfactin synthase thioesterase subunit